MGTPIEHIYEYRLSFDQFQALSKLEQAALAISSFAATEANTLMRLYVCAALPMIGDSAVDAINSLQRHTTLRIWSAKLFEFQNFIRELNTKCRQDNHQLVPIVSDMMRKSRQLRTGPGYKIVEEVRNSSSNHYLLDRALENLEHLSPLADLRMFAHELEGNSVSPIGEEVMFVGILNRFKTEAQEANYYEAWHKWNTQASKWLKECHLAFWEETAFKQFPEIYGRKKAHWLPEEFVGEIDSDFTPLFLRRQS